MGDDRDAGGLLWIWWILLIAALVPFAFLGFQAASQTSSAPAGVVVALAPLVAGFQGR